MRIELWPYSNEPHLHQIFAGFHALQCFDGFEVRYRLDPKERVATFREPPSMWADFVVGARIENGPLICYDLMDGGKVLEQLYGACDYYFKRSFSPVEHAAYPKMRPMGLNFFINSDEWGLGSALRGWSLGGTRRERAKALARALRLPLPFTVRSGNFGAAPRPAADPKVLFLTRLWDPAKNIDPKPENIEHQCEINAARALMIRKLRRAFGARFVGGVAPTPFAREHFADVVAEVPTSRRAFLANLPKYDICISTSGLHRSTGWKFAEYMAYGRAIVTEPLAFGAPLGFGAPHNYLPFETPDQCVETVEALIADRAAREQMMFRNFLYYCQAIEPRPLVLNSLHAALGAPAA